MIRPKNLAAFRHQHPTPSESEKEIMYVEMMRVVPAHIIQHDQECTPFRMLLELLKCQAGAA